MKLGYFILTGLVACLLSIPTVLVGQPGDPPVIVLYSPDSAVQLAAADLATVDPAERPYIRYLSLYNIPKPDRRVLAQSISFLVNSLGTRRRLYIPLFVGNSEETLIRLNIKLYDWDPKVWDDLAAQGSGPRAQPEPYFHALIEKDRPAEGDGPTQKKTTQIKKKVNKPVVKKVSVLKGYKNGQPVFSEESVTEIVEEEITETIEGELAKPQAEPAAGGSVTKFKAVTAPWLDPTAIAFLIDQTQAVSPILRADWFLANASLPPFYYNFLKLGKKDKDFEKLIFADEDLAKKARGQDKAVVVTSTVARNNRTLNRSPTFTNGYYWVSHDSKSSVDDRQYVQNILDEKFDATEDIGTLPNGLQAYFLTNGQGERLDVADPDIAIDNGAVDRLVRTGRSCIVCHAEGIRPIEDEVRALTKRLKDQDQVRLLIPKFDDALRIDDLFGSDLDEQIIKDQNIYAAAVAKVNGLKMEVNAKLFGIIYDTYVEVLLNKEVVALDLGVSPEELEQLIRLSTDPVALGLLRTPIRPVRRDQWERTFQGLMLIRIGRVPIGGAGVVIAAPNPVFEKR